VKVLNLYAGIGGNRKLWKNVQVTAVENNPKIADMYKKNFPEDTLIVGDAHQYLLEHYKKFDFIWSSPPCQTHSVTNNFLHSQGVIRYPDMALYQEIIFLRRFFEGKWCVENVRGYYDPLIVCQISGRHYFWCNFKITNFRTPKDNIGSMHNKVFTIKAQKASKKSQAERNAVYSPLGLHIFNCAFKIRQEALVPLAVNNKEDGLLNTEVNH